MEQVTGPSQQHRSKWHCYEDVTQESLAEVQSSSSTKQGREGKDREAGEARPQEWASPTAMSSHALACFSDYSVMEQRKGS